MKQELVDIFNFFSEIKDHRRSNANVRHEFTDIISVALCGMLSGADDWVSISQYGKKREDWLSTFLSLPNGIPSHDTFGRVFARIDPDEFMDCFLKWVNSFRQTIGKEVIAVDGKTLRRSHDSSGKSSAIHMVSAWATESKLVLGQIKTAEKSNEITAIPELLQLLELDKCLVTIDAMGCQKSIAQKIIDKNGDYLLAVKGNQRKLFDAIQAVLGHNSPKSYKKPAIGFCTTDEKSRNRHEIRRCWVTSSLTKLSMSQDWPGLKSIAMVESERTLDGSTSIERRYYICSSDASAEEINKAARSHWGVENSLHWVLDMAFREDECRTRKGNGAENLARLRHFALNLLKQETTTKIGIKNKRLKAGWSNDYLLKVLGVSL